MELEALVDFVDDVLLAHRVITEAHIASFCRAMRERGVTRLVWGYYGDGRGGYIHPSGYDRSRHDWSFYTAVYGGGRNPLAEATRACRDLGMEIYAYFKPYETGPDLLFPEGSPEAERWGVIPQVGGRLCWLSPFTAEHPELRIGRIDPVEPRDDPVTEIVLVKQDDAPTRVSAEHLQIWTSDKNFRYEPRDLPITCEESVETATHDVTDINGRVVTPKGTPVRTLTLRGFRLTDPFILVTTDFEDDGDFVNLGTEMMRCRHEDGTEAVGSFASGSALYERDRVDFRNRGVVFDHGWLATPVMLDCSNASGRSGCIAWARGVNRYLSGALCETEPAVRDHWLDTVDHLLAVGVDGVELRIENHSCHTDEPRAYGMSPAVADALGESKRTDRAAVAAVRGDAYTEFLRRACERIRAAGKTMRVNLNVDLFRPDPPAHRAPAYPAGMEFQWRRWIDEGLLDAATLRTYTLRDVVREDAFAAEMTGRCAARGIPIAFNHHIFRDEAWFLDEFAAVRDDGRFESCILYEANTFTEYGEGDACTVTMNVVDEIAEAARR